MKKDIKSFEELSKEIRLNFEKQRILKYYPYGPETTFDSWLTGKVDLREIYKEKRNKHKTEKDYVFSIIEETARAMSYLTVWGYEEGFAHQRIEAFNLWQLFHNGIIGWSKKPLKGKTPEEIDEIVRINNEKYSVLDSDNDPNSFMYKQNKEMEKYYKKHPDKKKELEELELKAKKYNLKKYGVYEVKHLPLTQPSNVFKKPKILYTKQELAAIDLYVSMAFENLC
jgi:hypothetical protein